MKAVDEINLKFTSLTTTDSKSTIINMGGVDFIASIGMRLLLTCAKAKKSRGGIFILANLQPFVKEALETSGINTLIPITTDESTALTFLKD